MCMYVHVYASDTLLEAPQLVFARADQGAGRVLSCVASRDLLWFALVTATVTCVSLSCVCMCVCVYVRV